MAVEEQARKGAGGEGAAAREESAQARVRRLVIRPLEADGFRHPRGTSDNAAKRYREQMTQDLSYLTEGTLEALYRVLLVNGEGGKKCFWPARASYLSWASMMQPRPLEENEPLMRWFRSKAGKEALARGEHVHQFWYWQRYSKPPVEAGARRRIAARAQEDNRRRALIAERQNRGVEVARDEILWAQSFDEEDARVSALIQGVTA